MTDPGVDLSVSLFVQAPAKWLFNVQFKKLEEEDHRKAVVAVGDLEFGRHVFQSNTLISRSCCADRINFVY